MLSSRTRSELVAASGVAPHIATFVADVMSVLSVLRLVTANSEIGCGSRESHSVSHAYETCMVCVSVPLTRSPVVKDQLYLPISIAVFDKMSSGNYFFYFSVANHVFPILFLGNAFDGTKGT
jgi:hypothetical protein